MSKFLQWIRKRYAKIVSSIAFYPAVIAVCFLLLSWLMLEIDFSVWGKQLKLRSGWLSLKDASTARTIISTIVSGIMSLTVFSFSMVMIVLNQAASQMSNRVLNSMIENRFQQIVLGFYIGTIVYALFLLSTIRDINSGIYVPALSIYLLIIFTVVDIFFFLYFLDYVTQTVKYETVIRRVQKETLRSMEKQFVQTVDHPAEVNTLPFMQVNMQESGYFQSFDTRQLLRLAKEEDVVISIMHVKGTYLLKGTPFLEVYGKQLLNRQFIRKLFMAIDIFNGQPIGSNPDYGFHHLAEVAIKALSPGINDPATAVLSLHALTDLFAYRLHHFMPAVIKDENNRTRIMSEVSSFAALFEYCIFPVWQYGKNDGYIQQALLTMLQQLINVDDTKMEAAILNKLLNEVSLRMQKGNV